MDDKNKLEGKDIPFEATIEIDPSDITDIEVDGSMLEPSFSNEEEDEDFINQNSNTTSNNKNDSDDENDDNDVEELDDETLSELEDEELDNNQIEELSDDNSYSEVDSIPDQSEEVVSSDDSFNKSEGEEVTTDNTSSDGETISDNSESSSEVDDSKSDETSSPEDSKEGENVSTEDDTKSDDKTSSDNTTETPSDNSTTPEDSKEKPDTSSTDNKTDGKEPSGDSDSMPENKNKKPNAADTAKDKTKDAAKDKAKDAADTAKDKAKDTADAVKDKAADAAKDVAKDKAKDAAKNNSIGNKADIAKNTKDAFKKGPKGLVGAPGIRAAIAASENTNPYSKAAAGILKVLDLVLGKDRVNWILDKGGEKVLRKIMWATLLAIVSTLIPIILIIIGIYMVFAPMLDALVEIDLGARKLANTAEKFKNLYTNGRFADSKETFYKELDLLKKIYGDELDESLLMSTLFYPEMKNGYETRYDNIGDIIVDSQLNEDQKATILQTFLATAYEEIKSIAQESNETYDPSTGLYYTVGTTYRLRTLASQMFSSKFLGSADNYIGEEITLREWIDRFGERMLATVQDTIIALTTKLASDLLFNAAGALLIAAGANIAIGGGPVGWVIGTLVMVVGGILEFIGIDAMSDTLAQAKDDFTLLLNSGYLGYMSLKSIDLDGITSTDVFKDWDAVLDNVKITLYSYKYSEENYKEYLRKVYIPKSLDFEEFLSYDKNGVPTEASIERVVNDIYTYRDYFVDLFYEKEEDYSEDYSQLCIGAIDKKLAAAMDLPTDINTTNCIDFSGKNGFGYTSDGLMHNGIELNADSTGNVEGDKVYSVMNNGTVKASSLDNNIECVGGCLEIEYHYDMQGLVDNSTYNYSVVYKGLSKNSITHKTGDVITGDTAADRVIGTIGSAEESENMGKPSLYIEFRNDQGTAIDPTNMIVKCNSASVSDYPGATTIDIPQTFKQDPSGYTWTCYGGTGWYGDKCSWDSNKVWDAAPRQKKTWDIWVAQGRRYKNGVAVISVDGVDRYLVAVVTKIGYAGDVINAKLANGEVAPLIIGDSKGAGVTGDGWGHKIPGTDLIDVIEMEVDIATIRPQGSNTKCNPGYCTGRVSTDPWGIEWDSSSPVVSFTNNGSILNGDFDVTTVGDGGNTGTSSNGLTLCPSMYNNASADLYVNKAIEMANNDTIGYSQSTRKLNPNVDCSSFVYYSLTKSNIMPDTGTPFVTSTMGGVLKANGFAELDYDRSILEKGDIVVDPSSHTTIYIGDGKQVSAHSNYDGVDGDSQGNEVNISNYSEGSHNYTKIYRLNSEKVASPQKASAGVGSTTPSSGKTYGNAKGTTLITFKGAKYAVIDTKYPGGLEGYQNMLEKNGICQTAIGENGKCKIGSYKAKSGWGGCCGGFSQAQACGLYKGMEVTQSSGKLSSCNNNGTLGCSTGWGSGKCFDSVSSFLQYVITNIQSGYPVIINVTGCNGNNASCKAPAGKYSRHYVTVVGFKEGTDGTSYKDLLILDSWDSNLEVMGKRKIQTDGIIINGHPCKSSSKNYAAVIK